MGQLETIVENQEKLFRLVQEQNRIIEVLWSLQDEWVTAKKASQITGVHVSTLVTERQRPNTVLQHKKEGNKDFYEKKSLINYNNKKMGMRTIDPVQVREALLQAS